MKKAEFLLVSSLLLLSVPSYFDVNNVAAQTAIYDPTNPMNEVQPIEINEVENEKTDFTSESVESGDTKRTEEYETTGYSENKERDKEAEKELKTQVRKKKKQPRVVLADDFSEIVMEFEDDFTGGNGNYTKELFYIEMVKNTVGTLLYGRKN